MEKHRKRLFLDLALVCASAALAVWLATSGWLDAVVSHTNGYYILAAFLAGTFFTSAFTTPPTIAILAKLSLAHSPFVIAVVGGVGALLGDLVIFFFVRHRVKEDVSYFLAKAKSRRVRHILDHRFARWSLALVGAIVIASPLPDELGLAMMGLSDLKTGYFVPTSLFFNVIGILLIAFIARSV